MARHHALPLLSSHQKLSLLQKSPRLEIEKGAKTTVVTLGELRRLALMVLNCWMYTVQLRDLIIFMLNFCFD